MGATSIRGCVDRDPVEHTGSTPENTPRVVQGKRVPDHGGKAGKHGRQPKRSNTQDLETAAEEARRILTQLENHHDYQELADAIIVGQGYGVSKDIIANAKTRLAQLEREKKVKDTTGKAVDRLAGLCRILDNSDVDALNDAITKAAKETKAALEMCKEHLEQLRAKIQEQKRTNLLEHYVLEAKCGEGTYGVVYACRSRATDEQFAVKMVDKVESPLQAIMDEVKVLEQLNHPNIVRFVDVLYEKCFVCIVMDIYVANLVTCMLAHWKAKGKILMPQCRVVCKQMAVGMAYLHSKSIVHRDVKGDNYLTTKEELSDPNIKVVLTDFGTAITIHPEEKFHEACGTRAYWAPEFYDREYGLKVDVWAIGVIAYALLDGKFPFQDENDVKNSYLKLPKHTPETFEQFIRGCLTRDETKRLSAEQMAKHEFLEDVKENDTDRRESKTMEKSESDNTQEQIGQIFAQLDIKEDVADRRDELVGRLMKWYDAIEGDEAGDGDGSPTKRASASANLPRGGSKNMVDCGRHARGAPEPGFAWQDKFQVHAHKKSETFEWWDAEKVAAEESLSAEGAKVEKGGVEGNFLSTEFVSRMLAESNIDVGAFGRNEAKTLNHLALEVQNGTARLMLDATQHKKLVRVVDVVLLRLKVASPERFLVEVAERYPDGRKRQAFRLPGTKKEPHESTKEAANRILADILHMTDCNIEFSWDKEVFEESQESPSYPGLTTVYRKEVVEATVTTTDATIQERICLIGKVDKLEVEDKKGSVKFYSWLDEGSCEEKHVQLTAPHERTQISGLVQAPIGMTVEQLCKFLLSGNIDVSKFGQNHTKSLKEFSQELVKGESSLMQEPSGRVMRIVDLVALRIVDEKIGRILVQTETVHRDGAIDNKIQLPGHKRRPDENQFAPVKRLVVKELGIEENCMHIDADDVHVREEEKDSPSYPGLRTLYRKRIVTVHVERSDGV